LIVLLSVSNLLYPSQDVLKINAAIEKANCSIHLDFFLVSKVDSQDLCICDTNIIPIAL